jgi:small subunit ribosomal protein S20
VVPAPTVANHKSALKRHRQSVTRQARNQAIRTRLRHLVRAVREAVAGRDANAAAESLARATRALDKAVTKGVVHRNSASRRIARLSHAVHELKTAQ